MSHQDGPDLDFVSFVDHAVGRVAGEVPGADAEALHTILLLHRASDVVVYDLESSVHRPAGWSFAGFRLMFVLWLAGAMPSGRLARLTGSSRAATSALAKTLEADGLVIRRSDHSDRRTVVLDLSDAGRERLLLASRRRPRTRLRVADIRAPLPVGDRDAQRPRPRGRGLPSARACSTNSCASCC